MEQEQSVSSSVVQHSAQGALEAAEADIVAQVETKLDSSVSMGVDIVEIARIKAILSRSGAFARRAFSEAEQQYCNATSAPERHYATRFAAKEAVLKALGTGFSCGIRPRDVEVVLNAAGKPRVRLYGRAREIAHRLAIQEIPISLSFTHKEAVACAMALRRDQIATPSKTSDQKQELTRQFKEARAFLDDIE